MIVRLLPGLDGTGELFGPLVGALTGVRIEVARYQREVASYDELLRLQAPPSEDTVLVAESFGGPLAIRMAAASSTVRALVLVASFSRAPALARWMAPFARLAPRPPRAAIRAFMVGFDASDALVDEVQHAIASVPRETLSARIRAVATVDVGADLARVTAPVTWIVAKHDRLVGAPTDRGERRLVDGPHLLAQRRPDEVAAIVRAQCR